MPIKREAKTNLRPRYFCTNQVYRCAPAVTTTTTTKMTITKLANYNSSGAFSEAQVIEYLNYISLPEAALELAPLDLLTSIIHHHRANIPFESLDLHYTPSRHLSIEPLDVLQKVLHRRRGGYCMEVNTLFANILWALSYELFTIGARTNTGPNGLYDGFNHMAMLVDIDDVRYLVDVGCAAYGPPVPLPLVDGHEMVGVPPLKIRIQQKALPGSRTSRLKSWVYGFQTAAMEWRDWYAFSEAEFLPADYDMVNYTMSTSRMSIMVNTIMVQKTIMCDGVTVGSKQMASNSYRQTMGAESSESIVFKTEADRHVALEEHFDIKLTEKEKRAIQGLGSEIRSGL